MNCLLSVLEGFSSCRSALWTTLSQRKAEAVAAGEVEEKSNFGLAHGFNGSLFSGLDKNMKYFFSQNSR